MCVKNFEGLLVAYVHFAPQGSNRTPPGQHQKPSGSQSGIWELYRNHLSEYITQCCQTRVLNPTINKAAKITAWMSSLIPRRRI